MFGALPLSLKSYCQSGCVRSQLNTQLWLIIPKKYFIFLFPVICGQLEISLVSRKIYYPRQREANIMGMEGEKALHERLGGDWVSVMGLMVACWGPVGVP